MCRRDSGVTVTDGALTAYKAVGDDWQTDRKGWVYAPGATVTADDWDGKPECGGGPHLCLSPRQAGGHYSIATRPVYCPLHVTAAGALVSVQVEGRTLPRRPRGHPHRPTRAAIAASTTASAPPAPSARSCCSTPPGRPQSR